MRAGVGRTALCCFLDDPCGNKDALKLKSGRVSLITGNLRFTSHEAYPTADQTAIMIQTKRTIPLVFVGLLVGAFLFVACDDLITTEDGDDEIDRDDPQAEIITQEFSEDEIAATLEYWTPERMAEAIPVDDIGIAGDPPPSEDPVIPDPDAPEVTRPGDPPAIERDASRTNGANSLMDQSAPNNAVEVTTLPAYPHRAMGKVFFTIPGVGDRECSGGVIASDNRSVVWTAGHCLAEGGGETWYENFMFVPAYFDGDEPAERWAARTLATFVGWYSNEYFNYDLGAAVMERRDGQSIVDVTGSLGWMFNAAHETDTSQFGYPGEGTIFNGQRMWTCNEPYTGAVNRGSSGPSMQTNDCDYTAGASGGPWVVNVEDCPNCYINSVNSLWWFFTPRPADLGNQWAGPYQGSAARNLLEVAEGL